MRSRGWRPQYVLRSAMGRIALLIFATVAGVRAAEPPAADDSVRAWRGDAEITSIHFIDPQQGWAVGEQGVIWHTDDGGLHWTLQHTDVACRLNSVAFANSQNGWAAGGWTQPFTHLSAGLVLRTRDGGRTWQRESKPLMPAIRRIGLAGNAPAWAVSDSSAMNPAGLLSGSGEGREWTPLPLLEFHQWQAGDFSDAGSAALADDAGRLWTLRGNELSLATAPEFGLRRAQCLRFATHERAWLVGDGGLLLVSNDGGRAWLRPRELSLPTDGEIDFQAVAARGAHVWIGGAPGHVVLHSADAGRTWQVQRLDLTTPIRTLHFIDDQHGWAGGALGAIFATTDGGATWRRQSGTRTRAALLAFFSDADQLAPELFARTAAADGCLAHAELLTRRDLEPAAEQSPRAGARMSEAVSSVGGNGCGAAWQFPLRQPGIQTSAEQVLARWKQLSGDDLSAQRLQSHIARQLRTWRPDVVVLGDCDSDDPLAPLLHRAALAGLEQAASEQPRQVFDLPVWSAKKLFLRSGAAQSGGVSISTSQVSPQLGRSLADLSWRARSVLTAQAASSPTVLGFREISLTAADARSSHATDFWSGLNLPNDGPARRPLVFGGPENVESLGRAAIKRRNLQAILSQTLRSNHAQLSSQMGQMISGLDADSACELLAQLGQRLHQEGQWDLAEKTFELLADRYPEHPAAATALIWLVQYQASSAALQRSKTGPDFPVKQAAGQMELAAENSTTQSMQSRRSVQQTARLTELLQRQHPELLAEPRVLFPLAASWRALGQKDQAEKIYQQILSSRPHDAWWSCADTERWLTDRRAVTPRPMVRCGTHGVRPKLDGQFDDPIWKSATKLELLSPLADDADWPATAMLAGDEEHLYVAVTCHKASGVDYSAGAGRRERDADLHRNDRVEILLDPDRNYATYYRLAIDHRGWTAESCWGDATWNPTWFVAQSSTDDAWTIEIAIPWDQLVRNSPRSGNLWALGLQRTVPGVGFQSWTNPACTDIAPQGFGLLKFD